MIDMEAQPIPSLSTIGRLLRRRELTHRRAGRYIPKGKKYPELPGALPNQTHQVDLVGPCCLPNRPDPVLQPECRRYRN